MPSPRSLDQGSSARALASVQPGQEAFVAVPGPQPFRVDQDAIGVMDGGQRRIGVQPGDLPDVTAEQGLFQRLGAEQVKGQRQHVLVPQHVVMASDDRLQFRLGPGRPIVP